MLTLLLSSVLMSAPLLSPVFGDHMVLQRDKPNTFWGWAKPGSKIQVSIGGKKATGTADEDGRWSARLTPPPAGGPYELLIEGPSTVVLHDLLVGDVWLCTGQSNMEFGLSQTHGGAAAVAAANHPQMRLCLMPRHVGYEPRVETGAPWRVCTSENVAKDGWGGFSGVGYHFGLKLQQELHVPIGLVEIAWGGTSAEAWTSERALRPLKDFDEALGVVDSRAGIEGPVFGTYNDLWLLANDLGSRDHWEKVDTRWPTTTAPNGIDGLPLGSSRGVVWFKKSIELPAKLPAGEATLNLGQINETYTTWINGKFVGTTSFDWATRSYHLAPGMLQPGTNVITVRLFNARVSGGFLSPAADLYLDAGDGKRVGLAGEWQAKLSLDATKLTTKPRDTEPNPTVPSVLFNGMIAPVAPLAIRGAIWYQGETNAGRGYQYRELLPAMIADWRRHFGQGDFPFYIVSLANFQERKTEPGDDYWAELREAQAMTAARAKHAGLALAIDIGDAADVHPKDKRTVGERLAANALALEFGMKVPYSGPTFRSMKVAGRELRLSFDHTDGGLVAKGPLGEFSVAGSDHRWRWATARISGLEIIVSSPQVEQPVAVRYAWQSNPMATLYNGAGFPAVPFRSDDWPGVSVGNH